MQHNEKATLTAIQQANPQYQIHALTAPEFARYGQVYSQYDLTAINAYMDEQIDIPQDKNFYRTSNPTLEAIPELQKIGRDIYAGLSVQAGECVGQSTSLSAVEFHQGSEVNVFQTDVVMVLGKRSDFVAGKFAADQKAKLFFVPRGSVVEFYSDTLHYSPCKVHPSGFKFIVMVIRGTNQPLPADFKSANPMIVKQNKFQVVHATRKDKIAQGIQVGVTGQLVTVNPLTK